ncbi:hypothetical protein ACQP1W_34220 [Spirillospora sp. CA-255316]
MAPVILVLLGVALPLGLVGAIGPASTMSTNVLDRTREFGVMHAIGAPPKAVRRIVVVLGDGLGDLFVKTPLPFRISPLAAGIWPALALLVSALATEAAATRASGITVRQALSHL